MVIKVDCNFTPEIAWCGGGEGRIKSFPEERDASLEETVSITRVRETALMYNMMGAEGEGSSENSPKKQDKEITDFSGFYTG